MGNLRQSNRTGNWSDATGATGPWGVSGTANAAVTTTTGPPGTLTDTRLALVTNSLVGGVVTCNGKTITVASNTATAITGTAGWSGGGNPGNGFAYTVAVPVPTTADWVVITAGTTVTIDTSAAATIDIGDDGVHDAISIAGALTWGAGSHNLQLKGWGRITNGGVVNFGSLATPIPNGTTMYFVCNNSAALAVGKYGFEIQAGGTYNAYGVVRSAGGKTLITSDAASGQAVINVADDLTAGGQAWANGEQIVVSATDRVQNHHEVMTISSVTSSAITCTANLANTHHGAASEPLRGFVMLLAANTGMKAMNTADGYPVYIRSTAIVNAQYALFQDLAYDAGSSSAGLYSEQTTGTINIVNCLIRDVARSAFLGAGALNGTCAVRNCRVYNTNTEAGTNHAFSYSQVSTPVSPAYFDFSGNYYVGANSVTTSAALNILHRQVNVSGSRVSGYGKGFVVACGSAANAAPPPSPGYFDNLHAMSCNYGMELGAAFAWLGYNAAHWWFIRNGTNGIDYTTTTTFPMTNCEITDLQCIGNVQAGILLMMNKVRLINPVVKGETSFSQQTGMTPQPGSNDIELINPVFSNHTSADFSVGALAAQGGDIYLFNPSLAAGIPSLHDPRHRRFFSTRYGGTATDHRINTNIGDITSETTTRHTASGYAWKMAPNTYANGARLRTPNFKVAVKANVAITISLWTAKDAAYNGAQQTLRLFGGYVQGIASDVTANAVNAGANTPPLAGDWEQLTLAPVTPTEDGVLEFCVECDGSAGAVYVDDVSWS